MRSPRRALLLTTLLAGCDSVAITATVVRVEARPAVREVELLEVTLSNDNATLMETFTVGGRDFPLTFSVETPDREGALAITARAYDEDGALIGLGTGAGTIVPDEVAGATLRLDPADFPVNTAFAGQQRLAWTSSAAGVQLAADRDGRFTIGFTDDCGELIRCDLWGRRFDARSIPIDTELEASDAQFHINRTEVFGNDPALAISADGTMLAVWTTFEEILATTITPGGGAGAPSETLVSSGSSPGDPTVAALPGNQFVVVWTETDPEGEVHVRGRFLDRNSLPAANPETGTAGAFTIDTGSGNPTTPVVVALDDDSLALGFVWRDGTNIKVRFTDASGQLVPGTDVTIAGHPGLDDVWSPQLAATPDGHYLVAWGHRSFGGAVDEGEIVARKIAAPTGAALGPDARLATDLPDSFTRFGLAGSDGPLVITWHGCDAAGDDSNCGVRARVFRDTGLPVGDAFVVNTTTDGNQTEPSIAWMGSPDGVPAFALSWTDDSRAEPDTSATGIRARVLYPAFDDARAVLGAPCSAADPCGEGLVCQAGSDDTPRCHAACDPGEPVPQQCPDGGVCTTAGDGAACIF